MFWGKSRERQFAVNDDETKEIRPKTAPQPKTLKQRKVIDGDAHTKQKSLKLFKYFCSGKNISYSFRRLRPFSQSCYNPLKL